jgi:hypothetical protein
VQTISISLTYYQVKILQHSTSNKQHKALAISKLEFKYILGLLPWYQPSTLVHTLRFHFINLFNYFMDATNMD